MEILREQDGFIITQKKFIEDLLSEFYCSRLSMVSSPLDPSFKLTTSSSSSLADASIYRRLVGKLNYLTHTRPDLSFTVLTLSQYMQKPCLDRFITSLRVLCYLRTNPGQGLLLNSKPSLSLLVFCDVDWASCRDTRRSISGFFISLEGSPVS